MYQTLRLRSGTAVSEPVTMPTHHIRELTGEDLRGMFPELAGRRPVEAEISPPYVTLSAARLHRFEEPFTVHEPVEALREGTVTPSEFFAFMSRSGRRKEALRALSAMAVEV